MRIGVLGGSFNPIHIGHLILAEDAARQLRLDKVLLIPANIPPHKAKGKEQGAKSGTRHRVNMVKLAVKGNPLFAVSDIEIERGGVSYTVETLRVLKNIYKGAKLYLIVGSDSAANLCKWRKVDEIMRLATIAIGMRPDASIKKSHLPKGNYVYIKMPLIDVASSDIRDRIRKGRSVKYLVPLAVEEYIVRNKLYSDKSEFRH